MTDHSIRQAGRIVVTPGALACLVAGGIYVLLLLLGPRLLGDPDTYWQIALGDWVTGHWQVPRVDTFSSTMAGAPWISSQWLAQVLFAQAYAWMGWTGVVVLSTAAIAGAQGLLTRILLDRLAATPAVTLSVAGFVLAAPHMAARPHALALPVMVAWISGLMRALDQRRAPSFALLPLMALWANLHGGFTFGLFFIAPVALEALWTAGAGERRRAFATWCAFGALALAAACITPYGPQSILVTLRILGLGHALAVISEWQPQNFATFGAFEACLLAGIGYALYRGLTLPPTRILILLGLLHMALSHTRSSEMLGLLAPLVIAGPLANQIGGAPPVRHGASWLQSLALALALAIATAATAQWIDDRPSARITPERAVAAIKASGKTHVLNDYNFGGYLIAAGIAPYIDGRTELYGETFFMRHDDAVSLRDVGSFLRLLRDDHIDVTLLMPSTPAVGLLDHLKGWKRVYADDIAVVHVRSEPSAAEDVR